MRQRRSSIVLKSVFGIEKGLVGHMALRHASAERSAPLAATIGADRAGMRPSWCRFLERGADKGWAVGRDSHRAELAEGQGVVW